MAGIEGLSSFHLFRDMRRSPMDFENIAQFLDEIEIGLADLVTKYSQSSAASRQIAAQTQALFVAYVMEDISHKAARFRLNQLEEQNDLAAGLWDDVNEKVASIVELLQCYRTTTSVGSAILNEFNAGTSEASLIVQQCGIEHQTVKRRWQLLQDQMGSGPKTEVRSIEVRVLEILEELYDCSSTEKFQAFALAVVGRLLKKNTVEKFKSDFKHGNDAFHFVRQATEKCFGMPPEKVLNCC